MWTQNNLNDNSLKGQIIKHLHIGIVSQEEQ